jgi:hypothetical protein
VQKREESLKTAIDEKIKSLKQKINTHMKKIKSLSKKIEIGNKKAFTQEYMEYSIAGGERERERERESSTEASGGARSGVEESLLKARAGSGNLSFLLQIAKERCIK